MHLQVKASVPKSGMPVDDDESEEHAISATYHAGALVEILTVLKNAGFNLRSAGGSQIEFGGEFTFWVDGRNDNEDHDAAAHAAKQLLESEGWPAQVFEVRAKRLHDHSGSLLEWVQEIADEGLLIQDIHVGTKDDDGIPVQIFVAQVGAASS
jgi:hypothetical protein